MSWINWKKWCWKNNSVKMLNGLIKPDAGRIELKGKIAALIALGAGFNPFLQDEKIFILMGQF